MATEVAQAYVQIIPSADGITNKLQDALGDSMGGIGKAAGGDLLGSLIGGFTGGALGSMIGGAVESAVKGIPQALSQAVETGKAFDQSMSQVAATMGTTTDQIGELRDFAREMGSTTVFSASQASEALNYMALAGYDAETSMQMLPSVLNLAAAGNMDLARASDMVTDSQSALSLSLDETGALVDQMAAAASSSNTSVEQLGDAILTVGGTASYMKGGTQELSTVLGVLADNGVKGAEGGTHLRNILLSLTSPTDKAKQKLEELGVQVFDAQGKMRSFADIFPDLNAALSSLSDDQKLEAMSTIFNSRDIASANALMHTSIERWNQLGDAIDKSQGAAEKMAATQLDNLAGDITLLESATEGLQIAISDLVEPFARGWTQFKTGIVTGLTELITPATEAEKAIRAVQESAEAVQGYDDSLSLTQRYQELTEKAGDASLSADELAGVEAELSGVTSALAGKYPELFGNLDTTSAAFGAQVEVLQQLAEIARMQALAEFSKNAGGMVEQLFGLQDAADQAQGKLEGLQEVANKRLDIDTETALANVKELRDSLQQDIKLGDVKLGSQDYQNRIAEIQDAMSVLMGKDYTITGLDHLNMVLAEIDNGTIPVGNGLQTLSSSLSEAGAEAQRTSAELAMTQNTLQALLGSGLLTMDSLRLMSGRTDLSLGDLGLTMKDVAGKVANGSMTMAEASRVYGVSTDSIQNYMRRTHQAGDASEEMADSQSDLASALDELADAADDAMSSGGDLRDAYEELSKQFEAVKDSGDAATVAMVENKLRTLELLATNQELVAALGDIPGALEGVGNVMSTLDLSGVLISTGVSAEQFAGQVVSMRDTIINSFQLIQTESGVTAQKMVETLTANNQAVANWGSNLEQLWWQAYNMQDVAAMRYVSYLYEQGPQYALAVQGFVEGGYDVLQQAGEQFALAGQTSAEQYAAYLQGQDYLAGLAGGQVGDATVEGIQNALNTGDTQGAAQGVVEELTGELDTAAPQIQSAVESAVTTAMGAVDLSGAFAGLGPEMQEAMTTTMGSVDFTAAFTTIGPGIQNGLGAAMAGVDYTAVFAGAGPGIQAGLGAAIAGVDFTAAFSGVGPGIQSALTAGIGAIDLGGPVAGVIAAAAAAGYGASSAFTGVGIAASSYTGYGIRGASGLVSGAVLSAMSRGLAAGYGATGGFYSVGYQVSAGIASGISGGSSLITSAISSAISSALATAKAQAGIASPSRVFRDQVGRMIPAGVALGISDGQAEVDRSMDLLDRSLSLRTAVNAPESGRSDGGTVVNMNIYGAEGQDVQALARIVVQQLYRQLRSRRAGMRS